MDVLEAVTDRCIRRGLGLVGLATGAVMLLLSSDPALALRAGGNLAAVTAVALFLAAWQAAQHDQWGRRLLSMIGALRPELLRGWSRNELQRLLNEVFQRRLVWHAQRVGAVAVTFWLVAAVIAVTKRV